MNWFHRHDWKEIARTYAEPVPYYKQPFVPLDDTWTSEKFTVGCTTILFQCEKCQKLRSFEMLGREQVGLRRLGRAVAEQVGMGES